MLRLIVANVIVLELARRQARKLAHGGYRIGEQETGLSIISSYTRWTICEEIHVAG